MITQAIRKITEQIDNNNTIIQKNLEEMEEIRCKISDSVLEDACNVENVVHMRDSYKKLEFSIGILREEKNEYKTEAISILEKSVGELS